MTESLIDPGMISYVCMRILDWKMSSSSSFGDGKYLMLWVVMMKSAKDCNHFLRDNLRGKIFFVKNSIHFCEKH